MDTSCNEIRQQFLAHDWDTSTLDEAARIAEHLRHCAVCRLAVNDFDQLRHLLRPSEPMPDLPADNLNRPAVLLEARPRRDRRSDWPWAAALAASLVIGLSGWAMYLHAPQPSLQAARPQSESKGEPRSNSHEPRPAAAQQAVQWTRADIERDVQVFNNVSETFQGRTSWVAMGDRAADLGLMPAAGRDRKVLLLRLVMSQGEEPRSTTDLVIVPGQDASLDVPFESGQVLRYHIATTAGAGRRLSLWAEVRTPNGNGETLAALATQLKPVPGQSLSAGRLVTFSGGYNLEICFQENQLSGAIP